MSKSMVIKGGDVLLPTGQSEKRDILIEDGIISRIHSDLNAVEQIDASGAYVLPGLVDLHTHGMCFEATTTGSIENYAALEAERGATSLYPAMFGPPEDSAEHMRRHRRETDEFRELPQIKGFRLESPYLAYTGAGLTGDLAPITDDTTNLLLDAGGGLVKIWDISPELPGAIDLIRRLSRDGIVCSFAHTRANIEECRGGVEAGARLVTHLFNTFLVPELVDPGVYPVGIVDYLLVEDRMVCEIVGDSLHAHPLLVEKAFRCKTSDRLVFVSDSNVGSGLPPGQYTLPRGWGNVMIQGPNKGLRIINRGMILAGSAISPIDIFRNVVRIFGKDMATASQVCSRNPARLMGLSTGEVAEGLDADLILLDQDLELLCTIAAGRMVYKKED